MWTLKIELFIFDEMYKPGLLNNEIADEIKSMGYAKELIIADSAERKSIEEIRRYGIRKIHTG
ncbi:terminase large subunit [Bacillus altitudinis]|uniref:terminase large subunit n=1 Tax=Bacillus altitudinis TaxID=293387 RepID=UPI003CF6D0BC